MKKLSVIVATLTCVAFSACQQPSASTGDYWRTFTNKADGYSMKVPKTWGAISTWGGSFTPNLYDEMEEMGPDLPTTMDARDNEKYYIALEVFDKNASAMKPNQSLLDFYKELNLKDQHYLEDKIDDHNTEITLLSKPQPTCGMMLMKAKDTSIGIVMLDDSGKPMNDAPVFEQKCFDNNNNAEFYSRTCRLIEHNDKLYSFCYNNSNSLHNQIIQSVKFL